MFRYWFRIHLEKTYDFQAREKPLVSMEKKAANCQLTVQILTINALQTSKKTVFLWENVLTDLLTNGTKGLSNWFCVAYRMICWNIMKEPLRGICDECITAGQNKSLGPKIQLPRLGCFDSWNVSFLSNRFSNEEVISISSPRSEFVVTLAASRPEDGLLDLTAISFFGLIILSIAVRIAFWIYCSTAWTMLPISLSILSLKHFSIDWTFNVFSLVDGTPMLLSTVFLVDGTVIDHKILLSPVHNVNNNSVLIKVI